MKDALILKYSTYQKDKVEFTGGGGSSIVKAMTMVKVPGDVPPTTVYFFRLLVWPRIYFLAILVWRGYAFWQFRSEKGQILVIPLQKPKILGSLILRTPNFGNFCLTTTHGTFDVEFSLDNGTFHTFTFTFTSLSQDCCSQRYYFETVGSTPLPEI